MTVCPAKTRIGLGIRPVWSESSLCAQWVAKDPSFLQADSEDPDQTGWMPRLIWIFAGHTDHFVGFVTRRLIRLSYFTWGAINNSQYTAVCKFNEFWREEKNKKLKKKGYRIWWVKVEVGRKPTYFFIWPNYHWLSVLRLHWQYTANLFIFTIINFHILPMECQFPEIYFHVSMACFINFNESIKFSRWFCFAKTSASRILRK